MRLLFITDHRYHKPFDSVYALAAWVDSIEGVDAYVSSIGTSDNTSRMKQAPFTYISAVRPNQNLVYQKRRSCFSTAPHCLPVTDFDVICLRVLPICITSLQSLEESFSHARFINTVDGIIKTESKEYLSNIAAHCPTLKVCHTKEQALEFISRGPAVLKPRYGYGGYSNLLINDESLFDGANTFPRSHLVSLLTEKFKCGESYIAMEFLPRYVKGDKRILVVNGSIVGTSLRVPQESWLCNISSGGKVLKASVKQEERNAINQITPQLEQEGITMYGVDTLENEQGHRQVTEINTCCPGGFHSISHTLGDPLIQAKTVQAFKGNLGI